MSQVVKACEGCGKVFIVSISQKLQRFCNKACSYKHGCRGRPRIIDHTRICKQCGVFFETNEKEQIFCSRECHDYYQTFPIGHETICSVNGGKSYVRVKVSGRHPSGQARYRRKHLIVAEKILGRELAPYERAIPIDGDFTNCSVANIEIERRRQVWACKKCGKTREGPSNKIGCVCSECNPSIKLDKKRVALIRALLPQLKDRTGKKQGNRTKNYILTLSTVAPWFRVTITTITNVLRGKTWKEVKPMKATETWKALLEQADELVKEGIAGLYALVTLLVKVSEDQNYLDEMKKQGKTVDELLNKRLKHTGKNFPLWRQFLKAYPRRTQWEKGDIEEMFLEMAKKQSKHRQSNKKGGKSAKRRTRQAVTMKEHEELKDKLKDADVNKKGLQSDIKHLQDQLKMANGRINSLERTNQNYEQLIESLREMLGRKDEEISKLKLRLERQEQHV